jgi:hypothetical protein
VSWAPQRDASGEQDLNKAISVDLHAKNIEIIQELEACPGLRTLDLSFNSIGKMSG